MNKGRAAGVGGWLALLVFTIGVLTPLAQLASVLAMSNAAPRLGLYFGEAWPIYHTATLFIIGIRIIICLYVAKILMYEKNPKTPRLAILGIWFAYVVLGALSLVVFGVFSPTPVSLMRIVQKISWLIVICVIASAYLIKSRRVANTYS